MRHLLLAVFSLIACTGGDPAAGTDPADEAEDSHELHAHPDEVEAWGIQAGPVGHTTIAAEMTLPGALGVNENRTALIAPLVSGQIAELSVDLGSRVRGGQMLATLNSPEFARAKTEFLQAFTQAELSRNDYDRALILRESEALDEREFLRRQSLFEQHLAERRAAEVILHSMGLGEEWMRELEATLDPTLPAEEHGAVDSPLPVFAPLAGVVIERDAVLGDHVEAGKTLFTVSDLTVLWAHLDAYENQLAHLDQSAEAVVRSPQYPGQDFPGRITVISDQVDPELRTVRVRVEVSNRDGALRPNMYVQGFLRSHSPDQERIVVPEGAVQLFEGEQVVFVELPGEPGEPQTVYQARAVVPGEILSVGQVIESGLDGTELVVTEGAFTIKAELTKGAGGHGHVH
jgi:cobalt-zinc-cadmium efflux system membrane fusion protein